MTHKDTSPNAWTAPDCRHLTCIPRFEIFLAKAVRVVQPQPQGHTKDVRMGKQDEGEDVMVPEDGPLGIWLLLVPLQRQGTASRYRTISLCVTETWSAPGEKPRHKLWHKMQKYEMAVHHSRKMGRVLSHQCEDREVWAVPLHLRTDCRRQLF